MKNTGQSGSENKARERNARITERGNVFFTLFGAVAVVGVLGAGIMATMRGPLTTMVEVNRRTQAESEMSIASKLALLEAVETLSNGGDCDGDGYVEPLEFKDAGAGDKPTGGGYLPDAVGSNKEDPWGMNYGYCAWDAGTIIDDAACDDDSSASYERLDGSGLDDATYTVIALISAGPDRIFQTTCTGGGSPDITKAAGSDDIINAFTYEAAVAGTGGLWKLKSGSADIAEIGKDLEVTGGATFTEAIDLSTTATAQLKLGAASMLLPDQVTLATCDASTVNLVRINKVSDPDTLEICDDAADDGSGPFTWQSVAAGATAASLWQNDGAGGPGEIYYNTDNVGIGLTDPAQALDVVGNIQLTEDLMLANSKSVVWASGASVTEASDALEINANGGSGVEMTVDSDFVNILANVAITKQGLGDPFTVDGTALVVENGGNVGVGKVPGEDLDVAGVINADDNYMIDGNTVVNSDSTMSSTILLGNAAGANVTGDENTIAGAGAGATLTTGEGNLLLGVGVDVPAAATNDYLNIGNAIHGDLAGKRIGIGFADDYDVSGLSNALEVNGNIDATGTIHADGDITSGTNITATGDVTGADLYATSQVFVDGDQLGPPAECDSDEKLEWNSGAGWSCVTDQNDGSGGGGSGLGLFEINGIVVRTKDDDAPWATSDFVFGSPQMDDDGDATHDNRMFFDKSKGAFRAGSAQGTQWDTGNVGVYSAAFGINTTASGQYSTATGYYSDATGDYSVAMGNGHATASGSVAIGTGTASGAFGVSIGSSTVASGVNSTAIGSVTTASGLYAIAIGKDVLAGDGTAGNGAGDNSLAIGLGTNIANKPQVTGVSSMGIFMGSQANKDLQAANTLALVGGKMVIDGTNANPAAATGGEEDLELDVEGDIGADNYCDSDGDNCFAAADVSGASSSIFEVTGGAGTELIRTIDADAPWATSDFVIGSGSLNNVAGTDDDYRMFFDKSLGAFRAGYDSAGFWNTATNVGIRSVAMGNNSYASGDDSKTFGRSSNSSGPDSMTWGAVTTASGTRATAWGTSTTASQTNSTAWGDGSVANGLSGSTAGGTLVSASGTGSLALGRKARVTGDYSVVFGVGDASTATYPLVSGASSFGIFMGDQQAKDVQAANTLALVGGKMVIDGTNANPAAATGGDQDLELDVEGDIGADNYCDSDGDNCFVAADVGSASSIFEVTGGAGTELVRTIDADAPWTSSDFVFGSPQLADDGNAAHDSRMYFDKSQSAFRAGLVTGTQWDSPGQYSTAMGYGTTASGDFSTAIGRDNTASGTSSVAMGQGAVASSLGAISLGYGTNAGNQYAFASGVSTAATGTGGVAMGRETASQGEFSMAFGALNGGQTTDPRVSGHGSVAFFMGTGADSQSGVNVSANNTFGIFGGPVIIDAAQPATVTAAATGGEQNLELDVEGDIGADNYCDSDGDNCFTAADVGSATGIALDDIDAADGDNTIANAAHNQIWNWELTAAETAFTFGESAASAGGSGDQHILAAKTLATSTAMPLYIQNLGEGRSFQIDDVAADTTPFYIDKDGHVNVGGKAFINEPSAGAGVYIGNGAMFSGDDVGMYEQGGDGAIAVFDPTDSLYRYGGGILSITTGSAVGINTPAPSTGGDQDLELDVHGDIGADNYCDRDGDNCFDYTDISGGGGLFEINGTVVRTKDATAPWTSSDFVFGSSQLADTTNAAHDSRMFFDKSRSAFRAGYASGAQWDDASVGNYSVAFGLDTTASGDNSFAGGWLAEATGTSSFAFGNAAEAGAADAVAIGASATATGDNSVALGNGIASGANSMSWGLNTTEASGDYSTAWGYGTAASNDFSTSWGAGSTASGSASTAWGGSTTASGAYSTAFGEGAIASGTHAIAMGRAVRAGSGTAGDGAGDYSMAIGLGASQTGTVQVTGDNSLGIFMGDQGGAVDITASNVMAILGGNVGIGTATPGSPLHVTGQMRIDATGANRLTIEASDSSNLWNIDNSAGLLRIFREDFADSGTGVNGAVRVAITDAGNMGIGDPSPDSGTGGQLKLDVQGPVGATAYCDASGNNCFDYTDIGGGAAGDEIIDADSDTKIQVEEAADEDQIRFDTAGNERMVIDNTGNVGIGVSPTVRLDVLATADADGFLFTGAATSGEKDVFTIVDPDGAGTGQDESSSLKVLRTGALNAAADGASLLELTYTGGTFGVDRQFYTLGRLTDEGAVTWGVSLNDSDIWTTGALRAGATGTDCASTNAACFNTPTIAFETSGDSYINTSGNFGLGDPTPNAKLSFANNVATGYLDNFNEYQIIMFEGGNASGSYGMGIKGNTIVFNSGAGAYSFDKAGASSSMVIDTGGDVGIGDPTPDTGAQNLKLDVEGAVGATHYCDEAGNNCKTAASLGGGVTWVGYTAADNGILGIPGGVKGANALCNATYAGSRAMTYDDWMKLGTNYPYTSHAWLIDGSYSDGTNQITKDGQANSNTGGIAPMCAGWLSNGGGNHGPYVSTAGYVALTTCVSSLAIGCVQ
jgi:hypothetical protein